MFWLLQKQALVSIPLALSMVLAAWNPLPAFAPRIFSALIVLAIGIVGEAHRRYASFAAFAPIRQIAAALCDAGLWGWSRHPNYFFEWFGWLAYPLLAIDLPAEHFPWGWAALAGPACMYWLLVHVSGIPPLEAHMLERRSDEFRDYQARTNAFFPAPPRAD